MQKIELRSGQLYNLIEGDVVIPPNEEVVPYGLITGDVDVMPKGKLVLRGMVSGSVTVEKGAVAEISGMVAKAVQSSGGRIDISGMVIGPILGDKSEVTIRSTAFIGGKSK